MVFVTVFWFTSGIWITSSCGVGGGLVLSVVSAFKNFDSSNGRKILCLECGMTVDIQQLSDRI